MTTATLTPSTTRIIYTHGNSGYNRGCRCITCTTQHALSWAEVRASRNDRPMREILQVRALMHPQGTKDCARCRRSLSFTAFRQVRRERDGLQQQCSACESTQNRLRTQLNRIVPRKANGEYGCAYCNADANSIDHFMPSALGGRNDITNVVHCCLRCNIEKASSEPYTWMASQGYTVSRHKKFKG